MKTGRLPALLTGVALALLLPAGAEVLLRWTVGGPTLERYTLYRLHGADGYTMISAARDPVLLLDEASALLSPDLRLLWSLRPSLELVADNLSFGQPSPWTVRTGADGFRLPSAPEAELIALGDSCTFGWGVEDQEAWPSALSRRLGRPVRNLGVPGYSLLQGEALLDTLAVPADRTLILAFGANDGHKVLRGDNEWLAERASPAGGARAWLAGLYLIQWGQHALYPAYARATALAAPELGPRVSPGEFGAALARLHRRGNPLVLISICARDEYRREMEAAAGRPPLVVADALGIPTLDGCHPTASGHATLAAAVDGALAAAGRPAGGGAIDVNSSSPQMSR